jgi:hypothetical protein
MQTGRYRGRRFVDSWPRLLRKKQLVDTAMPFGDKDANVQLVECQILVQTGKISARKCDYEGEANG